MTSSTTSEQKREEIVEDIMKDLRKHLKTIDDTNWLFEKREETVSQ